jgi:hypothetical protein
VIAWAVAAPLALAGAQLAHECAYRLAAPDAHQREALLRSTGHGYLAYVPVGTAVLALLLFAGLVAAGEAGRRGRAVRPPARWPFALLPFLIFATQEHLETAVHSGGFQSVVHERTFLLGMALQLPVAVLAYGVARLLLRVAQTLGHALAPPPAFSMRPTQAWTLDSPGLPRQLVFVRGRPARGPPLLPAH